MGRNPQIEERLINIHHLHPHHRSMARALVVGGLRPGELAEQYNFSPSQVSVIINSPLFKAEVARIEALAEVQTVDARRELEMLQGRSLEVLSEDLHSLDRRLRNKTAVDVLDRTGHPKGVSVQEHKHLHAHLHEEVKKMNQRELYETIMNLVEEDVEEGVANGS